MMGFILFNIKSFVGNGLLTAMILNFTIPTWKSMQNLPKPKD